MEMEAGRTASGKAAELGLDPRPMRISLCSSQHHSGAVTFVPAKGWVGTDRVWCAELSPVDLIIWVMRKHKGYVNSLQLYHQFLHFIIF